MLLTLASASPSADLVIQRAGNAPKSVDTFGHPVAGVSAGIDVALEDTSPANVPEPDTLALVGTVVAVVALIALFRRKRGK